MAREHHCPNCGAQSCNASTSKIHTCGVCASIWEEDLSAPVAAPAAPKPAATAPVSPTSAPPKPAAPIATPPKPAPAAPAAPAPTASAAAPKPTAPPAPASAPAAAPKPPAAPAAPAVPNVPAAKQAAPGGAKTLTEALQAAKVKRCPACQSDGVAKPSDFSMVQGRVVLVDSQTYRGHRWYADTGELLPAGAPPPPAPSAPGPAAGPSPAT